MESMVIISTRAVGRRKRLLDDWSIPYPPDLNEDGDNLTLRDLITRVVQANVQAFRKRQEQSRFVRALSEREIEQSAEKGKVYMGGSELKQEVDEEEALTCALQAFEDGLYLVILDDEQQRDLDKQVFLRPDSRITFLRLIMLAGG